MNKIIDYLRWRYATKKMNGKIIPEEKVAYILEAIRLSASSSGLQPYKLLVISNRELLKKIKPIAHDQSQITDCSHLIIFAAWDNYSAERINNVFNRMNAERHIPNSQTEDYKNNIITGYAKKTAEENYHHTAKQAYIALGTALVAAAEQQVDATPMEGFNYEALNTLLDLRSQGLRVATLLALGYRDTPNDWLVGLKKVRTPKEEFITEIK